VLRTRDRGYADRTGNRRPCGPRAPAELRAAPPRRAAGPCTGLGVGRSRRVGTAAGPAGPAGAHGPHRPARTAGTGPRPRRDLRFTSPAAGLTGSTEHSASRTTPE